jgi:hypothetical protein
MRRTNDLINYTDKSHKVFNTKWTQQFKATLPNPLECAGAYGGAIYLNRTSSSQVVISIIRCSFQNINLGTSYDYGAFYIKSVKSVNISSSSFQTISSSYYAIGRIDSISTCVLFHNCECVDCTASDYYVGGLILSSYSWSTDDADDCVNVSSRGVIFSSSFIGCVASNQVGGVCIYASSTATVRSCIFDSCSAGTNGGGIYLSFSSSNAAKEQILFYSFFQWKYMWKF